MTDSREAEWVKQLTFGGIPTTVTYLEQGDAMVACDDEKMLLIERKTPSDFLNSLRDERLLPQLTDMLIMTRWCYLVITGEFLRGSNGSVVTDRGETGWSYAAVQGALLTIQEMGIFVIFCGGDEDYEGCILRLGNRDRREDLLLKPPKLPQILSAQEAVLASFPGVGIERLKTILDYCGTPAWSLVALTDPTTAIPGIPGNVKIKVRAALGLQENEQIGILTSEEGHEVLKVIPLGSQ